MFIIPLVLLSLLFVYRIDPKCGKFSFIYMTSVLLIHSLYVFEFHIGNINYFISDETVFMGAEGAHQLTEIAKNERILWFEFLSFTSMGDFTGGLFSKLSSLIFIPLLLLFIKKLNKDSDYIYYVFCFCPYLLFVSQTALRDILILTLVLGLFYFLCNKNLFSFNKLITIVILSLCLFMLRPFYLFTIIFVYYLVTFFYKISNENIFEKIKTLIGTIFIVLISLVLIYISFGDKIDQYIRSITYIFENGISLDDSKSDVKPALNFSYFMYSLARYITTPIPSSLVGRILMEPTEFGYVDDVIRLINQSLLYVMYTYIIINIHLLSRVFQSIMLNKYTACFTIFTIFNSIIYSLYYAGGGHSRLKLLYFIFIFLICDRIFMSKKIRNKM
jgi:hypothetical protein